MPLIFQDRIVSDDLHAHPDRLFLFGDNELRRGRGGQAAACRGHTNAVGVATMRAPDREDSAYWTDADYDRITTVIDHDLAPAFDHIRLGGTVVCPSAGLGTGRAELPSRAPRVFAYLRQSIIRLKRLGDTVPPRGASRACSTNVTFADCCRRTPATAAGPRRSETRSSSDATEPATRCATNTKRGCRHNRN